MVVSTTMEEDRILTQEMATAMLPKTKRIHTYRGSGSMLIGCERDAKDIKACFPAAKTLLKSGPNMAGMGYGLCIVENDGGQLFVFTKKV